MNLGDAQVPDGVSPLLEEPDDDAVDPHLVRVKNEAGGEDSDEEVKLLSYFLFFSFKSSWRYHGIFPLVFNFVKLHLCVSSLLGIVLPPLPIIYYSNLYYSLTLKYTVEPAIMYVYRESCAWFVFS